MNISEGQKLIKSKEYTKALNYFLGLKKKKCKYYNNLFLFRFDLL